jgi:SAM-dependent methyltransferase
VGTERRWLDSLWPFVRDHLPAPPARVLEIGCGRLGGFVPGARAVGYAAEGVDPQAPTERGYHRIEFEDYQPAQPVDAVVACTSLHHVGDLDRVLDGIGAVLSRGGVLIVVEWARERFDEATARWCFARLGATGDDSEEGWLHRHRDEWAASGLPWPRYLASSAAGARLHTGERILGALDTRFRRSTYAGGPYFFPDLADTTEADEQAAIDSGEIRANSIRYVGRPR